MPVAKLSREFYEKFGDKLTDELVNCLNSIDGSYRAELKDLFEAHFGRFEETLERRLVQTTAEIGARIEQVRAELRAEFRTELHAELGSVRSDIGSVKGEIRSVRSEIGAVKGDLGSLRAEIGSVKAELLKWNLAVWVPVTLALIGLYFKP